MKRKLYFNLWKSCFSLRFALLGKCNKVPANQPSQDKRMPSNAWVYRALLDGNTHREREWSRAHRRLLHTLNWNWISLFPLCHHWVSEYVIWTIIFFSLLLLGRIERDYVFMSMSYSKSVYAYICTYVFIFSTRKGASIGKTFIFYSPTHNLSFLLHSPISYTRAHILHSLLFHLTRLSLPFSINIYYLRRSLLGLLLKRNSLAILVSFSSVCFFHFHLTVFSPFFLVSYIFDVLCERKKKRARCDVMLAWILATCVVCLFWPLSRVNNARKSENKIWLRRWISEWVLLQVPMPI